MVEKDGFTSQERRHLASILVPNVMELDLGYRFKLRPRDGRRLWVGEFIRPEDQDAYPRFHMIMQIRFDQDISDIKVHRDKEQHVAGFDVQSLQLVTEEILRMRRILKDLDGQGARFMKVNLQDIDAVMGRTVYLDTKYLNKLRRQSELVQDQEQFPEENPEE